MRLHTRPVTIITILKVLLCKSFYTPFYNNIDIYDFDTLRRHVDNRTGIIVTYTGSEKKNSSKECEAVAYFEFILHLRMSSRYWTDHLNSN
jgi:hypothetical protein